MPDETPPIVSDAPTGGDSPSQTDAPAKVAESTAPVDKPAEGVSTPPTDKPAEGTPAPPKLDADLDEWAKGRGYALTTDNERKIAQDARNQQREVRNPKDAVAALDKTVAKVTPKAAADDPNNPIDPVEARMAKLEQATTNERNNRLRSEFITANKVTTEESAAMAAILEERIAKAKNPQAAFDYLTDPENLDLWHDAAKARIASGASPDAAVEAAKIEERERLAKTSNANGPARAATGTVPAKPQTDHERQLEIWNRPVVH